MRRYAIAIAMMFLLMIAIVWVVFNLALSADALTMEERCALRPEHPKCQTTTTTSPSTSTTTVPVTTTTTSSTTTSTTMVSTTSAIAGVGCSNTKDALSDPGAYLDQSDEDNIIVVAAGGHTIEGWASGRDWDSRYIGFRPETGYTGVWLQLCERVSAGLTVENVLTIMENAWALDPGIPIWLSPLNYYEDETCSVTGGNTIPTEGAVIADELSASMENVFRGPDLGPLTDSMLRRDNCHPNSSGVVLLGSQLVEFFDE